MSDLLIELLETLNDFQNNSEFMLSIMKDPNNFNIEDISDILKFMKQFNECCDKIKARKVITFIVNGGNNNGNND